jgi:hypothetical protein
VGGFCLFLVMNAGCTRSGDPAADPVPESPKDGATQQSEPTRVIHPDQVDRKDAGAPLDIDAAAELPRPWGDVSSGITVDGSSPNGPSRFEAKRSELTAAQLQALDGLRRIPAPQGEPATHTTSYRIGISDRNGAVTTYRAADWNLLNADEGDVALPSIDVHTLEPFLDAAHCLQFEETLEWLDVVRDAAADAGPSSAQAPAVSSATPGCFNAVALPMQCSEVPLRLQVENAGTYQLSLASCFGVPMVLTARSADGTSELGAATGTRTDCPVLVHSFAEPGSYSLTIRRRDASDCGGSGVWGAVFLRVRSADPS